LQKGQRGISFKFYPEIWVVIHLFF